MSTCVHPSFAQHTDRARGLVTCSLCGEVIADNQFEMDPAFSRGAQQSAKGASSGMRTKGFARPSRGVIQAPMGSSRPSIETARKAMLAIARQLSIPPPYVEIAAGVYKLAVQNNAVLGARNPVLCACLYIVCRRKSTSHLLMDFSDVTKDSPYSIMSYVRTICAATHTSIPPLDPGYYVSRLAVQLNLGEQQTEKVVILALKVLRAMKDDWINTGRRPLGPCAAALLVACRAYNLEIDVLQLVSFVRLSVITVLLRVQEFLATPSSDVANIDNYRRSDEALPAAYVHGVKCEPLRERESMLRELSRQYYDLVEEARTGAPPTKERCEKWKSFLEANASLQQSAALSGGSGGGGVSSGETVTLEDDVLDLTRLSSEEQLTILGLPTERVRVKKETLAVEGTEALKKEKGEGGDGGDGTKTADLDDAIKEYKDLMKHKAIASLEKSSSAAAAVSAGTTKEGGEQQEKQAAAATSATVNENTLGVEKGGSNNQAVLPPGEESADMQLVDEVEWVSVSSAEDIVEEYIVRDGEARLRKKKASLEAIKELNIEKSGIFDAASLPTEQTFSFLIPKSRKRTRLIQESESGVAALSRALKSRGAGQINLEGMEHLLPGITAASASHPQEAEDGVPGEVPMGDDAELEFTAGEDDEWPVE